MLKFAFWFSFFLLVFHVLTKKYINPYKLTMVFGKKGSGKTTLMIRLAFSYLSKGWNVVSTEPIPGCYLIDPDDIGFVHIPEHSVLLVDEVGMIWDNRHYKDFKPQVRDWFKLQRHYKVKVYLFSQTFDIDKKLRDLTDDMYLCTNLLRVFSWAKRIKRKTVLVKPAGDSPARIDEELSFDWLLMWPFGARMMTFIPKYAKFFDSHFAPVLPRKIYPEPNQNMPKWLRKKLRKRHRNARKMLHRVYKSATGNTYLHKGIILLRKVQLHFSGVFSKLLAFISRLISR